MWVNIDEMKDVTHIEYIRVYDYETKSPIGYAMDAVLATIDNRTYIEPKDFWFEDKYKKEIPGGLRPCLLHFSLKDGSAMRVHNCFLSIAVNDDKSHTHTFMSHYKIEPIE